jgi:hypothetical protein
MDAPAPRDGGVDAPLEDPDAGRDGGIDGGSDGGIDGGPDAGIDSGGCVGALPACTGVCALTTPTCEASTWVCRGPGFEAIETSCDGYDNDCDGATDEDCATCTVDEATIRLNLGSAFDLDFDFGCRAYLTSIISGADFTKVVPAVGELGGVQQYFGNANQDMGFALVDPNPDQQRVVVTYMCCVGCGCLARNGLTFLYTCGRGDPGCGCAAETNCPGFLDAPFLAAPQEDTALMTNGFPVSTPTGLAIGPGGSFYVGNWRPETCSIDPACTTCDPDHPGVECSATRLSCCYPSALGRLARFTPPGAGVEPTWRVVRELSGEQIFGLATGRDGSVWIGTYVSATEGRLHRYDPVADTIALVRTYPGAVYSLTQDRRSGDWYAELRASPKLVRLAEDGAALALPATVPADPAGDGTLQVGPDRRLYRLRSQADGEATLDVYALP